MEIEKIKKDYQRERDAIFNDPVLRKDAFRFCVKYSMLVEEYIVKIAGNKNYNFAIASAGSFNRRELSPCSDIDVMFIASSIEGSEEDIRSLIRDLWDCGIEVSHTIRDFYDIEKYILDDLHTFTQFFETRFLLGSEKIYLEWHQRLLSSLESADVNQLIYGFFNDINSRYEKFGDSSKTLEPNVKMSAGGLRDFQAVEWIYTLRYKCFLTDEKETTQAESFMDLIRESNRIFPAECERILESYKFILSVRNALHLTTGQRNDRLEFDAQTKVAKILDYKGNDAVQAFMKRYFEASTAILRFSKTMLKRFEEEISHPLSDYLAVELDQDFILKGNDISVVNKTSLTLADILRAFYYRGLYSARFDENLRSLSIESIQNFAPETTITARTVGYFRDILRLPKNVGDTFVNMNELGILGAFLPEFRELVGFFQPGVYHCYTADEHTLIAIKNLEALRGKDTPLARLFDSCKEKELLYMSVLLHDIAKPISVSGHEIIGSEMGATIMHRFGYEDGDVDIVRFLVNKHLMMEQTAFRRNLNDPATLKNFASNFDSIIKLDLLYLLTYADLSAVNPMIWTQWKADLLHELYRKAYDMIKAQISGEELLYSTAYEMPGSSAKGSENAAYQDHIDLFYDAGYAQHITKAEIESHIAEIEKNAGVSVFFKELNGFSN
ncbi:MAG TPA: HD domain-containing protein, partial [Ignavibacteriales bacterium]|nr:HD domain-containing protein [Ignavibacteriales bacterium]